MAQKVMTEQKKIEYGVRPIQIFEMVSISREKMESQLRMLICVVLKILVFFCLSISKQSPYVCG